MQIDDRAINFIKKAKAAGATKDEVAAFLRNKGYEFEYTPTSEKQTTQETQPQVQGVSSPNLATGTTRDIVNEMLLGAGPYVAGATNVIAKPLGTLTGAFLGSGKVEGADFNPIQSFQEGRKQFVEEQAAFAEEHPVAHAIASTVGFVGGIAANPLGKGVLKAGGKLGAKVASKLPQTTSPIVARAAERLPADVALGATVGGIHGAASDPEKTVNIERAALGTAQGGLMGAAFSMTSNTLPTAIAQATPKMPILGNTIAKLIPSENLRRIGADFLLTGSVASTLPAAMEGRTPTARDVAEGFGTIGLYQLGGLAAQKGFTGVRKFATEPTKRQLAAEQEAYARGKRIDDIRQEIVLSDEMIAKLNEQKQTLTEQKPETTATKQDKSAYRDLSKEINTQIADAQKTKEYLQAEQKALEKGGLTQRQKQPLPKPSEELINEIVKQDKGKTTREQAELLAEDMTQRAETPAEKLSFGEKIKTTAQKGVEKLRTAFDTLRPLKTIEEVGERTSGQRLPTNPSERLETLRSGEGAETRLRPILETIDTATKDGGKFTLQKADKLLQARKDIEAPGAQSDLGKSANIESKFSGDKNVETVAKAVTDLGKDTLELLHDSGRISDEKYNEWKQKEHYVPSVLDKEATAIGEDIVKTSPNDSMPNRFKKYEGGGERYKSATVSAMDLYEQAYRFKEINQAKKDTVEMLKRQADETGKLKAKLLNADAKTSPKKPNQIEVWEKGKRQIWEVPEEIANIFNPKPKVKMGKLAETGLKFLGGVQQTFKGGTTALAQSFAATNLMRDYVSAAGASETGGLIGRKQYEEAYNNIQQKTPLFKTFRKFFSPSATKISAEVFKANKDSVEQVASMTARPPKGQLAKGILDSFAGAFIRYAMNGVKSGAKWAKNNFVKAASYLGNTSEEVTRFAVFESALANEAKTTTQLNQWKANPDLIPERVLTKAGKEAREVTLNFRRQMHPAIEFTNRYLIPYFKPSILGAMRGWEALSNPKIAPKTWRFIANLAALEAVVNSGMADEKTVKNYNAINDEMKAKNFTIADKDGNVYLIPGSQELRPIIKMMSVPGEYFIRKAKGQERQGLLDEVKDAGAEALGNLTPVLPQINPFGKSFNVLGGQIAQTAYEIKMNKDTYSGVPIESATQLKQLPSERQTVNTPNTLIALSKGLAKKTGIEVSPLILNQIGKKLVSSAYKEDIFLLDNFIGYLGVGENLLKLPTTLQTNPFTRRFVADLNAPYTKEAQKTNERIKQATQIYNKALKERGFKNNDEKKFVGTMRNIEAQLKKLATAEIDLRKGLQVRFDKDYKDFKSGKLSKEELKEKKEKYLRNWQDKLDRITVLRRQMYQKALELKKPQ